MPVQRRGVAADDDVLALGGLDDIDGVGHAYHPGLLVEHRIVLDLEVLAFPQSLVDRVAFQHERQLD